MEFNARTRRQRVLVSEFITGGGLVGSPLPEALATEGELIISAILRDLMTMDSVAVITTRDYRLAPLRPRGQSVRTVVVHRDDKIDTVLNHNVDAAWWIAPETDGVLEQILDATIDAGIPVYGCAPPTVRVTADKLRCCAVLTRAGILTIPTVTGDAELPVAVTGWVVKPRFGAGCEETYLCLTPDSVRSLAKPGTVVQPYVNGVAASLSLICANGAVEIIACNRQRIVCRDGRFVSLGVEPNAFADLCAPMLPLARQIGLTFPDLWGYVGVDCILTADGPVVVEINPRLTTAYVGLSDVLGCNPAERILKLPDPAWWPPAIVRRHNQNCSAASCTA